MLELNKITKDYVVANTSTTVLKGISLTFRNCEFVSILGPSGCGKTTMLNIVGGLDKYTSGDLIINGKSTKTYSDRDWDTYRNHSIGFVFQSYNLISHQTILKNVELALSIGGISKKERKKLATEALIKVGLKDHLNKKPNQLSGGQCQRVSIARALVTNPDIILADEPTGALDTETSVQIMEILKEISKERLVVMVTHNPELAKKYSTRIVKFLDGMVQEDSNPVTEEEYNKLLEECKTKEIKEVDKTKRKKEKKSSMSLKTSISLSASNLLTKKKRTFITSLACSIGIIGISVILSVSNGINSYVNNVQQNSTSSNYLMINNTQSTFNFNQDEKVELPEYPENIDEVYIYEESKNVTTTKQYLNENYINYLEKNIHGNTKETDLTLGIQYTKSVGINLISYNNEYKIVKTSNWNEILNNNEFMKTQYDVLIGDNLAKEYNEVSLVLDTYNRISSTTLDELGISYDDSNKIRYKDLIGKEFKLIKNDDYYKKQDLGNNKSIFVTASSKDELENAYNNGISLKIVSIVRQNKNATNSWISSGIAYTEELTNKILELNEDSEVVKYQKENKDYNVLTGKSFNSESSSTSDFPSTSNETYESNLVKLGGESTPSSITIYPKDFDSKEKIIKILDSWNESEIYKIYGNEKDSNGNFIADTYKVTYDDFSTIIVSMLSDLINIITYALVAFSSISLIVSGIMIAIITYASVIERTKEIGTIRSLGGRKKDVSTVFIAEACIIGAVSAIIAIIVTLGINGIINLILSNVVQISNIASINIGIILFMIVFSIGLNLIASLIPSKIASKKDPVVALRAE